MAEAGNTSPPQGTQRQVLTAGFASVVAFSLDMFDLISLLYVASAIAPLFFLSDQPTLSLTAAYASYAVTLIMRPAGSAIFGNFADRRGRKRAMIVSVTGVGIVTALMGAVPTIHQIGLLAPIVFLTLRIVQGIFVGGVVASTHTIGTETVPERWRGLLSGLIGVGGVGARVAPRLPGSAGCLLAVPGRGLFGVGMEVHVLRRVDYGHPEPVHILGGARVAALGW